MAGEPRASTWSRWRSRRAVTPSRACVQLGGLHAASPRRSATPCDSRENAARPGGTRRGASPGQAAPGGRRGLAARARSRRLGLDAAARGGDPDPARHAQGRPPCPPQPGRHPSARPHRHELLGLPLPRPSHPHSTSPPSPSRWLRNLTWDFLASLLDGPDRPRTQGPIEQFRRSMVCFSTYLADCDPHREHSLVRSLSRRPRSSWPTSGDPCPTANHCVDCSMGAGLRRRRRRRTR